ncbi:MAG: cation:proton antiporter [Planctomycetes bacterium]|nr:cation:proton antiporter [Planctomycetota bacterium]
MYCPPLAFLGPHGESVLLPFLVQVTVIILAARLFASLFQKLGQPAAVGEMAAGLVLGPSVLGQFMPDLWPKLFDAGTHQVFGVLSELGLILLVFLVGLEFDFTRLRKQRRAAVCISAVGILLPFALGWGLARWIHARLESFVDPFGFALFMGTAMSITALPMLGRMMVELNITRTRLGAIAITAAAVGDASGWIMLAAVSAAVAAQFQSSATLWMIAETIGFALAMRFIARPMLRGWIRQALRQGDGDLQLNSLAILLGVIFLCAIATNLIGICAVFGAFMLGSVLSDEHEFRAAVACRLRDFVNVFFLPIFFTYTGLRTDIAALGTPELWACAAGVFLVAVLGKFGGCTLAAWASGLSLRESACIGAMMNTRGLMELFVVNVGYELGVIPRSVFCMLVLMALLTTVMTTVMLRVFMRGTELERFIAESGLGASRWQSRAWQSSADGVGIARIVQRAIAF